LTVLRYITLQGATLRTCNALITVNEQVFVPTNKQRRGLGTHFTRHILQFNIHTQQFTKLYLLFLAAHSS